MKTTIKTLGSLMMITVLFAPCKSAASEYDCGNFSSFAIGGIFDSDETPHLEFENNILYIEDFDSDEIEIVVCNRLGQIITTSNSTSIDLSTLPSARYYAREKYSGAGLMFYKR